MILEPELREKIIADLTGKTIETAHYVDSDQRPYWVITFTDGSEMCFRFMVELVG